MDSNSTEDDDDGDCEMVSMAITDQALVMPNYTRSVLQRAKMLHSVISSLCY